MHVRSFAASVAGKLEVSSLIAVEMEGSLSSHLAVLLFEGLVACYVQLEVVTSSCTSMVGLVATDVHLTPYAPPVAPLDVSARFAAPAAVLPTPASLALDLQEM